MASNEKKREGDLTKSDPAGITSTAVSTSTAVNTSPAVDNRSGSHYPVLRLSDYQKGEHWESIKRQLDELNSSSFKLSAIPVTEYNGLSIPLVNLQPSLLFYGLTAPERYNGAARWLLEHLTRGSRWLLLQAVSGAGKTRAILDVFANDRALDKTLLYFDLSALITTGSTPVKKFVQVDVASLRDELRTKQNDREASAMLFQSLVAARYMVVEYLRVNKGWEAESLLLAQLSVNRLTELCRISELVFRELVDRHLLGYGVIALQSVVAIDESNLALNASLGMFKSSKPQNPERPLLCCIGDALNGWQVIFSGTSFSHNQFDEAVVSNVVGQQTPRFSDLTKMDSLADVRRMMARFGIDTGSIPHDTLQLLTGRCRLTANAIQHLISEDQYRESERAAKRRVEKRDDTVVVVDSIREMKVDLSRQMRFRLSGNPASRALVEKILVGTLLQETMKYADLTPTEKEWADESFVWVSGRSQSVELNEPILVHAARDAFGSGWDPVTWIASRMSALSSAQQGYDFEQVAARKVAAGLKLGLLHIQDAGKPVPVTTAPDPETATTVMASPSVTLDDFLRCPQTLTMLLPANKDGPDVVFWVLCSNERWYAVLIQAKYYQTKICGKMTVAAVETISKPLLHGVAALRIFFPFTGATCTAKPDLLKDRVDGMDNFMYLDCDNAGGKILGKDLCDTLWRMKNKRKNVPT